MRILALIKAQILPSLLSLSLLAALTPVQADPLSFAPSVNSFSLAESVLDQQTQAIQAIEYDYGPYDIRLKEAYKGLGFQLQNAGDYLKAKDAYSRALQVSRVNEGLYSASQISIVKRLIELETGMANWERVNNHYGYLEHLYKRLYEKNDPRLEEGIRNVIVWHIDAANINLDGNRLEHLRKVNSLLKLRLEVAEATLSGEDPMFDTLKRDIAQSERRIYMASDLRKEMLRQRARYRRDRYLATSY